MQGLHFLEPVVKAKSKSDEATGLETGKRGNVMQTDRNVSADGSDKRAGEEIMVKHVRTSRSF